jgi:hypothetical protein
MDWLVEYNSTSYKINRGSFVTSFEDTNPNPASVTKVNPETYLKSLLAVSGKLPPPDDDTIYIMYFPSNVDPTDGTDSSCIVPTGKYCAYHYSYAATGGQNVRYAVMPDMEAGSCNSGCGPPGFASFTDVSSHELIEAITDPDGTGWYDDGAPSNDQNNCGEIGDICAVGGTQETATINGFMVQKEWSNKNKACIGSDPNAVVNDFTIAVDPVSVTVPRGGSATVTVTLTKTTGMAENVALTSPAAPTGLTAAFAPASATSAGGTSTMTVSAGGALTLGVLTMNVKGTGSAVNHSTLLTVNVIDAPDMAMTQGGGGSGGSGANGGGGCSVAGGGIAGSWAFAGLLLIALALRRRSA